jgi:hypothetical protein
MKRGVRMARQKANPTDNYPICMRCTAKVPRTDNINVVQLTARAEYWREMDGNRISICPQCSKELSYIVDKWWLNGGGKSKFKFDRHGRVVE